MESYFGIGALAVLIQFLTGVALCWKRSIWYPGLKKKFFPPPNTAILAGALWGLAAYTVAVWSSLVGTDYYKSGYFFSYRCFSLSSGVAPNVPILLLAGGLFYWSLMQLKRVEHVARRRSARSAVKNTGLPGEWLMQSVDRSARGTICDEHLAPCPSFSSDRRTAFRAVAHPAIVRIRALPLAASRGASRGLLGDGGYLDAVSVVLE
jgi:hypothetical protein